MDYGINNTKFMNYLIIVDNAKANDKIINLIQDQSAHIVQIIWTWFLCL